MQRPACIPSGVGETFGAREVLERPSRRGTKTRNEMALFIGIDPGVNTGLAVWDAGAGKFLALETLPIHQAIVKVMMWRDNVGHDLQVVFEDARKRQWFPRERNMSEYRGKLMGAGSVKRDCEIWEDFCTEYAIPYTALPPRKGLTKWDADTFARVTGWKGRTSNHARDAAMLVYGRKNNQTK